MQIKRKKSLSGSKKYAVALVAILLIGIAGFGLYTLFHKSPTTTTNNSINSSKINLDKPTVDQKAAGEDTKLNTTSNQSTNGQNSSVNISITASNINQSTLQIRSQIDILDNTGTCSLTLTGPNSKTVTRTANVQSLASTSTCMGFDIPTSELSNGQWKIVITYKNSTSTGSVSQSITIE